MKIVIKEDREGYKRAYKIRDTDDEKLAEKIGLPLSPPDFSDILDNAKKELHNEFVNRGLFNFDDVQRAQTGIREGILSVLLRKVIDSYRYVGKTQEVDK